jgi:prepilin peptidase CpaA
MLTITATQSVWFLPFVLPICLFVAWNDMRAMKIPNLAVYGLVAVFAVIGLIALPFGDYLWRWPHLFVVLVIGVVMNAAGVLGAGDAKFAAAAAPFVALGDMTLLLMLFASCLLAGFVVHRAVLHSPLRRLVADWASWETGKRFPMGLPLGTTLALYLALPLL